MRQNGQRSNVRFPYGNSGMKKGGKVKKQGYNDRLDESLGARKGKKSQSLKARRDESKGAKKAAVPIVGGETAIMPDLISGKGFSFDLAGMVLGLVSKKEMVLGNKIKAGDIIIGVKSYGIHTNGY